MLSKLLMLVALALACLSSYAYAQNPFNIRMDVVRNSVVFLHIKNDAGQLKEVGTGFLVSVPIKSDPNKAYWLLVTARHMVDPAWAGCPSTPDARSIYVVLNKKEYDPKSTEDGTLELPLFVPGPIPNGAWSFPSDDSVDIAVAVLNGQVFSRLALENQPFPVSQLPTKDELDKVDTGAQIVSAGLLLGASGTKRNYPIFKFGYVSSKPLEKISMVCCPDCPAKPQTEWMIAASLVPGNSGSPIVYAPAGFPISIQGQRAFLLGVQSSAMIGDDVAGMAPASFLIEAIERLNLVDADLSPNATSSKLQNTSTGAFPPTTAVPGPATHPK